MWYLETTQTTIRNNHPNLHPVICWNRTSVSRVRLDAKGSTSSNWAVPFPKICFLKGSLLHPIFQSCHLWAYVSHEYQGGYVSEDFGDWSHSSQSLQTQYLDQSSARIPNQTSDYQVSANQTFENKSMYIHCVCCPGSCACFQAA